MKILSLMTLVWYACVVYSHKSASKTDMEEKKLLNKVIIFVFFAHKIYPFWALNVLVTFLSMQVQKALGFPQNISICILKMNKGLTGLERHNSEYDRISFWVNYTFNFYQLEIHLRSTVWDSQH